MFVRKDIPLKLNQQQKEEYDRQQNKVWLDTDGAEMNKRANEMLAKNFKKQMEEKKKSELEDDVARQTSRIDRAAAKSAQLKGEV